MFQLRFVKGKGMTGNTVVIKTMTD